MLGVGIIGCGAISKMHIASFKDISECEIRAVSSKSEKSAKKVGEECNVPWYTDFNEMLERDDIQIVSICTPSGLHSEAAIAAANKGKHVIVEKPLDVTLEKIDAIIEACNRNKVKLNCIFNNRYREGNQLIKRAIDAGRFGKLINANMSVRWYRSPEYYQKSNWHGKISLDGGGALMNQSIHYIDLLLYFMGEVEAVSAYKDTLLHTYIEAEDTVVAACRFKNGALGTILATTSVYPGYPALIQITGDRGSASVSDGTILDWSFVDSDPLDEEAKLYSATTIDNSRASDPMAFDYHYHFVQIFNAVQSVLNDATPDIDGYEARKSVELILKIYDSADKNRA